jgi:cytochrome c oxidase subunit 1
MAVGFLLVFLIGGITGVFLASPPIDFAVTDTYYVVAHFHYVMVGGLFFALFAGLYFWFPKMSGRFLSEGWGKLHFWSLFIGFNLTFFPQFYLGLDGMPRRIADYHIDRWEPANLASTLGAFLVGASTLPFLWNVYRSLRKGRPAGPDPWEGNSLEWVTTSPPPHHNFHELPPIRSERPAFDHRHALAPVTDPDTRQDRG